MTKHLGNIILLLQENYFDNEDSFLFFHNVFNTCISFAAGASTVNYGCIRDRRNGLYLIEIKYMYIVSYQATKYVNEVYYKNDRNINDRVSVLSILF